jgi:hypothetical protein
MKRIGRMCFPENGGRVVGTGCNFPLVRLFSLPFAPLHHSGHLFAHGRQELPDADRSSITAYPDAAMLVKSPVMRGDPDSPDSRNQAMSRYPWTIHDSQRHCHSSLSPSRTASDCH